MKKTIHDTMLRARSMLFQAGGFVPLAKVDNTSLKDIYSMQSNGDLSVFINSFFKFAIALGAIAAVLRIAYAGYLYIGSDFWGNKGKAKEILTDVVIGLLLLLSIWIILNQINPDILQLRALNTIKETAQQVQQDQINQGREY